MGEYGRVAPKAKIIKNAGQAPDFYRIPAFTKSKRRKNENKEKTPGRKIHYHHRLQRI